MKKCKLHSFDDKINRSPSEGQPVHPNVVSTAIWNTKILPIVKPAVARQSCGYILNIISVEAKVSSIHCNRDSINNSVLQGSRCVNAAFVSTLLLSEARACTQRYVGLQHQKALQMRLKCLKFARSFRIRL
jgi:hypothetical protein